MTNRISTLVGVLAGALAIALLALAGAFGFLFSRPAQAQGGTFVTPRSITVVGNGDVKVQPDTAHVQIGVETSAATTTEALAQNNSQTEAIIAKLKELGIAEKDIQTSNFSINAQYNQDGREVTGYSVNNMVSVTIRDLAQAGALLDQVVQTGANRVYGISFSVNDPTALQSQARDKAMAEARARAEGLAKGANGSVGQVLTISEQIGAVQIPLPMMRAEMAQAAGSPVPVQAGEQTITAQVQVTFELR
ncbi:MAG: SIMPL domain-containing protein [Chloroflexaceae bacterium]|nr:SIMPL domain-containing protein [Chloroflexaceae bacterium]